MHTQSELTLQCGDFFGIQTMPRLKRVKVSQARVLSVGLQPM